MNKFRVSSHCRYVRGSSGGAIYDLKNEAVISLNRDAVEVLEMAFRGEANSSAYSDFLTSLCEKKLLDCFDYEEYSKDIGQRVRLKYVWLELTNRCNCRCLHCYGAFGLPSREQLKSELSFDEWKAVLSKIRHLKGDAIQFIGGEPLLFPRFSELLLYAHEIGINCIDIFTNAFFLNESIVRLIKDVGASVRVSLYGFDQESHERITQYDGSFKRLDYGLDLLRKYRIPTRIAVVLMKENQDYLDKIINYIQSKGHKYTGFDTVRRVQHSPQSSHEVTDRKILLRRMIAYPKFFTSHRSFCENQHWNSCWFGKFAITASGDVIPCIFARNLTCGNIRTDKFRYIRRNLLRYWKNTMDDVETCKNCEFRYSCIDCRPLAEGECGDFNAKYPRCLYNPYNSTWGQLN